MVESNQQQRPLSKVAGLAGTVVGGALGVYAGINLLIPLAAAFMCGWIAYKLAKEEAKPMVPAIAIQGGQGLWMLFGFVMLHLVNLNALDLVILAAGLTWLLVRPGVGPVIFLTAYQSIAFVVNLLTFLTATVGSTTHKALLVHLVFRVAAVLSMVVGLQQVRRRNTSALGVPLAEGSSGESAAAGE
jgi:hypothetical protein